jgi:hypothetical protein
MTTATSSVELIDDDIDTYEPNAETLEAFRDIEEKKNLLGPYSSVREMFRDFGVNVDL